MKYLLVFDLDGCLYNYNALPNFGFYSLCDEANALAAREVFPDLSYEAAQQLSARSFKEHHDCYGAFLPYAERVGADPLYVRRTLFKRYHAILFGLLEERHPQFFDHTAATSDAFARLNEGLFRNAILSHSCMEGWGKPILKKMGILEYFAPHLMMGMDDYDFVRKFESAEPMRRLITRARVAAPRVAFVEDSYRNALPAYNELGIKIALVHQEAPKPDKLLRGVHWYCASPADFLGEIENGWVKDAKVQQDLRFQC